MTQLNLRLADGPDQDVDDSVLGRIPSLWLLAGLFALLLLLGTARSLAVPDEGRYGEIGRWMLVSGDWLTPRLNGIPFFHKPPLLYWMEALSMALFGAHPWALRLVPELHAGVLQLALYFGVRHWVGEPLARRAALIQGTTLALLVGGQYVNHDMMVACWIAVAIVCFALSLLAGADKPNAWLAHAGFVACALGVLSKGLIGLLLPGLVLLLWVSWTHQWRRALRLPWFSGAAVFLLIALPWFVRAERAYPGMLGELFGKQQFSRFSGTGFNNDHPWWFYSVALVILMGPWIGWVGVQALRALRATGAPRSAAVGPATRTAQLEALCWIWAIGIVGFFSIPSSKLVGYVLPVVPPLAVLAALGWRNHQLRSRLKGWLWPGLLAMSVALAVTANYFAERYTMAQSSRDIGARLACLARPGDRVLMAAGFAYDLPFYAGLRLPMLVLQDWPAARRSAGDDWRRELFEGATFDPLAGQVLQAPERLAQAAQEAGRWLVQPVRAGNAAPPGFVEVERGRAWVLLRSMPTVPLPSATCAR